MRRERRRGTPLERQGAVGERPRAFEGAPLRTAVGAPLALPGSHDAEMSCTAALVLREQLSQCGGTLLLGPNTRGVASRFHDITRRAAAQ